MQFVPLIGRIFFSAIFIMFGLGHFTQTAAMADNYVPDFLPAKGLIVILTGVVIVVGGLMVLLGYRAKLGALMLAVFLLLVTFLVHLDGFLAGDQVGSAMFMQHLAMTGGALLIYHFGSGPKSMDNRAVSDG